MTRWRIVGAVALWAVLVLALQASNAHPAALVLMGVVAAFVATLFVFVDLCTDIRSVEWTRRSSVDDRPAGDRRVESVRRQSRNAWWAGAGGINATLVELVDDRLLAHHHIDRATDPAAADRMLTPALRKLVAQQRGQTAGVRALRQILHDIEAL